MAISKFKKPDKKFDSRIDGKKRFRLDRQVLHITRDIKINNEKTMLIGISKMRIGLNQV